MRSIAAAVLLACLGACGAPPVPATYSPEYEQNFMVACESQSSIEGLCACTWDRIEAEVPRADFDALERLAGAQREEAPLARQIERYAASCAASLSPAPDVELVPEP